jgi:hypothetical protein
MYLSKEREKNQFVYVGFQMGKRRTICDVRKPIFTDSIS